MFSIILISSVVAFFLFFITLAIIYCCIYAGYENDKEKEKLADKKADIALIVHIILFVGFIFAGIGISDNGDRKFVVEYQAQKYTIEASIENSDLTGLERIELVKLATELNKKLASRKYDFDKWYNVHYDNSIYDGVEFINLGGTQE